MKSHPLTYEFHSVSYIRCYWLPALDLHQILAALNQNSALFLSYLFLRSATIGKT